MLLLLLKLYAVQGLFVKYERALDASPINTLWSSLKYSSSNVGKLPQEAYLGASCILFWLPYGEVLPENQCVRIDLYVRFDNFQLLFSFKSFIKAFILLMVFYNCYFCQIRSFPFHRKS